MLLYSQVTTVTIMLAYYEFEHPCSVTWCCRNYNDVGS